MANVFLNCLIQVRPPGERASGPPDVVDDFKMFSCVGSLDPYGAAVRMAEHEDQPTSQGDRDLERADDLRGDDVACQADAVESSRQTLKDRCWHNPFIRASEDGGCWLALPFGSAPRVRVAADFRQDLRLERVLS